MTQKIFIVNFFNIMRKIYKKYISKELYIILYYHGGANLSIKMLNNTMILSNKKLLTSFFLKIIKGTKLIFRMV
jgi:hypothetical protein